MRLASITLFVVLHHLIPVDAVSAQGRPVPLDTVRVEVNSRASSALGADTRAVEVIDGETIRNSPATTIADALQWAFGVELMPMSPALADVSIRGSSFEQVLVLVDGVRMRDAQTGHFNMNLVVSLDQVERIEILRGPAASLYGSDAMAGVINIVTRKEGGGSSGRMARGSHASTELAISTRQVIGGIAADLAGGYRSSDGHRVGTDSEIAQGRLAVSIPTAGEPIRADLAYASRDFGAGGFYGNFPSFESTRTTTASARWRLLIDSTTSVEPVASYRRNSDDFILDRDDPARYRNLHTTNQFSGELIGRTALADWLSAAAGVHGTHDAIRSTALGDRSEWTSAASLELVASRTASSAATAGLRADRVISGKVVLSPSLSLGLRPTPFLRLRSSAGESFRSPTWTERFYRDPQNEGNPDLFPERAWTVDAGFDVTTRLGLRFAGTAFLRSAKDLIDWSRIEPDTISPFITRNVETAEFRGIEAQVAFDDLAGFDLELSGNWLSLESSSMAGFESKYALRPQAEKVALSVDRSFGILQGGVRAYRERRLGESGYNVVDARLAVEFGEIRLWSDARNLFDENYRDIGLNPAPGRSLWVGLEWRRVD
jgi:iron complex outermembrane receptor protein